MKRVPMPGQTMPCTGTKAARGCRSASPCGAVWVYHEDDLSQIADRRSGITGAKSSNHAVARGGRIAARNLEVDSKRGWDFVTNNNYDTTVRRLAEYVGCSPAHARKLPAYRE